jgi:hypothetical protein
MKEPTLRARNGRESSQEADKGTDCREAIMIALDRVPTGSVAKA